MKKKGAIECSSMCQSQYLSIYAVEKRLDSGMFKINDNIKLETTKMSTGYLNNDFDQ
jgi:hypothetical protein